MRTAVFLSLAVLAAATAPAGAANNLFTWTFTFDDVGIPVTLVYQYPTETGLAVRNSGTTPRHRQVRQRSLQLHRSLR